VPRWTVMLALVVAGEAIFGLPFVMVRIFRPTVLDVFGLSNTDLGAMFSLYGLVAMASYFPGGPLADRFPARRLMTAALLATAAGGLVYATLPERPTLMGLYAAFGLTTILLFWAAMLRATREWGGDDAQGRAYGFLDGGRGLVAAVIATLSVGLFSQMLPDPETASLEVRRAAMRSTILYFTAGTAIAAALVWALVPERETSASPGLRIDRRQVGRVLRKPTLWLQAVIVVCAYVGYKSTDDLSLLARDALGYDDVEAAALGTAVFWVRPVAAAGAGLLADRLGGSRVIGVCFLLLTAFGAAVALASGLGVAWLLWAAVLSTAAFLYALRGVYFAVFDEGHVPVELTGTAVGVVSVIGYTPDIFMGPVMGALLDGAPGVAGHQHVFWLISASAAVGAVATWAFREVAARTSPSPTAP
jgi:nitrate/nitrite transporter NarK